MKITMCPFLYINRCTICKKRQDSNIIPIHLQEYYAYVCVLCKSDAYCILNKFNNERINACKLSKMDSDIKLNI